jgi:hypothetical protein
MMSLILLFLFLFLHHTQEEEEQPNITACHLPLFLSLFAKSLLPQPPFIYAADLPPPSNNHTAPNSPSTPPVLLHNSIFLSLLRF